jgi:hypothetical protein
MGCVKYCRIMTLRQAALCLGDGTVHMATAVIRTRPFHTKGVSISMKETPSLRLRRRR